MKYYIDSNAWEQILECLDQTKGIHTENEESLRQFVEAIWYSNRDCTRHSNMFFFVEK